jgi:hypothetical protein
MSIARFLMRSRRAIRMRLDWLSRSILRMRRNALGFIFLRRRFDFFGLVLSATLGGLLVFALASALRCWPFTRRPCSRALPTRSLCASPASNILTRASGSEWYVPPRWQTVCRLSRRIAWRSYRVVCARYRSEVRRVQCYGLHTVCHLGGGGISGTACWIAGA